jgi:4'-phosphopantetheinyl transferase EntD
MHNTFICSEKLEYIKHLQVYKFSCDFNQAYYHAGLYNDFGIVYPDQIKSAGVIRQAEFLAGHYGA